MYFVVLLFYYNKKQILFNGYNKLSIMSSKKTEKSNKTDDGKDKSAINEINNMQKIIKDLTVNLNKLKTKFKSKSEPVKKEKI